MKRTSLIVALLLVAVGCGGAAPPAAMAYGEAAAKAGAPERTAAAGADGAPAAQSPAAQSPAAQSPAPAPPPAPHSKAPAPTPTSTNPRPDAKSAKSGPSVRAPVIIYQGELRMAADEDAIAKTIDRIIDVAEELGGHIGGRKDQSVQIKVPSASFRDALTKIEALGMVVSRSVTADDVSEEFHDLEVRLTNLKATRVRLQEFMARAANINDMLTVERELERVAQEIDRIEGRLEFLRSRAAMSVINVQLTPKPKPSVPIVTPREPPPQGTNLPIPWVSDVGIDPLLSLRK
jgi:hypothetical protein